MRPNHSGPVWNVDEERISFCLFIENELIKIKTYNVLNVFSIHCAFCSIQTYAMNKKPRTYSVIHRTPKLSSTHTIDWMGNKSFQGHRCCCHCHRHSMVGPNWCSNKIHSFGFEHNEHKLSASNEIQKKKQNTAFSILKFKEMQQLRKTEMNKKPNC